MGCTRRLRPGDPCTERLFGTSAEALRVIPLVLAVCLVVVSVAIVRRLGGGPFAQTLTAVAVAIAPPYLFLFHVLSMNSAEVVLWAATGWLLMVALDGNRRAAWLALGVTVGIGLLNKHSMVFLAGALGLGLVLTPARRVLQTPWPWAAGAIAAAIVAPHLAWQAANGWPTLEFARYAQAHEIAELSAPRFVAEPAGRQADCL
jgi:4-amino-4-deoxy-L-arabinose transferase-like glycosyltransferase